MRKLVNRTNHMLARFEVATFVFRAEGSTHPLPVPRGTGLTIPSDFKA